MTSHNIIPIIVITISSVAAPRKKNGGISPPVLLLSLVGIFEKRSNLFHAGYEWNAKKVKVLYHAKDALGVFDILRRFL